MNTKAAFGGVIISLFLLGTAMGTCYGAILASLSITPSAVFGCAFVLWITSSALFYRVSNLHPGVEWDDSGEYMTRRRDGWL